MIGMIGAFLAGLVGATAVARPSESAQPSPTEAHPDSAAADSGEHIDTAVAATEEIGAPVAEAVPVEHVEVDEASTPAAGPVESVPAAVEPVPGAVVPERVAQAMSKMTTSDAGVLIALLTTEEAVAVLDRMPTAEASKIVAAVPAPRGAELGRALLVRLSRDGR